MSCEAITAPPEVTAATIDAADWFNIGDRAV
jgi:hypothetical protein